MGSASGCERTPTVALLFMKWKGGPAMGFWLGPTPPPLNKPAGAACLCRALMEKSWERRRGTETPPRTGGGLDRLWVRLSPPLRPKGCALPQL